MKKSSLLVLSLLLVGCSKNNESIIETKSQEVLEVESSSLEQNIETEIDILKETLPNNDSGVENPQHEFYEIFGERDSDIEPPEGYFEMDMNYEEARLEGVESIFGEELTTKIYETYSEYENAEVLTDELYEKMKVLTNEIVLKAKESGYDLEKEMGGHPFYFLDFDEDGLPDYYEKEVYGSDPSKKSTSGDIYNDCYKVEHNMDLFKYYEQEWIELEDGTLILPYDSKSAEISICRSSTSYLENNLVTFFTIPLHFVGEIKHKPILDYDYDINNLKVAIYNPDDLEYAEIEFEVEDDYLHYKVDKGYGIYLIYDEKVDIDELLSPYKN